MSINLFVYGTLMYPDVFRNVLNKNSEAISGVVSGFRCKKIKKQKYPGVIRGKGAVAGLVYRDLSSSEIRLLDIYESEIYTRVPTTADCGESGLVDVDIYLIRNQYIHLVDKEEWTKEWYEKVR